jgi:phosphodiesterase/alkaline phosphatase D-like protein
MLPDSLLEKPSELKRRKFLISACVIAAGFIATPIDSQPIARKKSYSSVNMGLRKAQ